MEDWSPRAQRLLLRGTHRRKQSAVHAEFVQWLTDGKIPLTDALRTFLEQIDVLEYAVRTTGRTTTFGLTTEMVRDKDNQPYIECGYISTAPLLFFLGLDGRLGVSDGNSLPIVIASALHSYVESDAVLDELPDLHTEWHRILLGELPRGDRRPDDCIDLPVISEASDGYMRWWGDDRVRVHRTIVWDDEPLRDRLIGYACTYEEANRLARRLAPAMGRDIPATVSRII